MNGKRKSYLDEAQVAISHFVQWIVHVLVVVDPLHKVLLGLFGRHQPLVVGRVHLDIGHITIDDPRVITDGLDEKATESEGTLQ